jgi:hypothetical protein
VGTLGAGVLLAPALEASLDLDHAPMDRRTAVVVEGAPLSPRPTVVGEEMRADDLAVAEFVGLL